MSRIFKLGVGRERITPKIGTNLYGYPYDRFATGVHDDLNATAFAINNGEDTFIIFSLDICSLHIQEIKIIRELINKKLGVKENNIFFSAIHTHSGPCTHESTGWGQADTSYLDEILFPRLIVAAESALSSMKDAVMGIGSTESEVGINRRQITLEGNVLLGQNPWGLFNNEMTVFSFKEPDGAPIGIIVNYGCHGTSAGNGLEITRDWSGVMVDMLEKEYGCPCALLVGALGDTGPRLPSGKTVGEIHYMEELGTVAGIDAIRAYRTIKEYRVPDFKIKSLDITLPYEPLPEYEEVKEALAALGNFDELKAVKLKIGLKYKRIIDIYEGRATKEDGFRFKATAFCLGDVAFIGFPFEVFGAICMRIALHSPFEKTLTLSNFNGSNGYFPSKGEILLGGYEVDMFKVFNGLSIDNDADTIAVQRAVDELNKLKAEI